MDLYMASNQDPHLRLHTHSNSSWPASAFPPPWSLQYSIQGGGGATAHRGSGIGEQSRKLKARYGERNRFQEPSLELSSQTTVHRLAGRYDNPMPNWFLAPVEGHRVSPCL